MSISPTTFMNFCIPLAAGLFAASMAHGSCTVSGQGSTAKLECDLQTMNKSKSSSESQRNPAVAPVTIFVAPDTPAGSIMAAPASTAENASLRPTMKEGEVPLDTAPKPGK